jgi:hypothetical protein
MSLDPPSPILVIPESVSTVTMQLLWLKVLGPVITDTADLHLGDRSSAHAGRDCGSSRECQRGAQEGSSVHTLSMSGDFQEKG